MNIYLLNFISKYYKIKPRKHTHLKNKHQNKLNKLIKHCKFLGFLPSTNHLIITKK